MVDLLVGVDDDVLELLRKRAEKEGVTLEELARDILHRAAGLAKEPHAPLPR